MSLGWDSDLLYEQRVYEHGVKGQKWGQQKHRVKKERPRKEPTEEHGEFFPKEKEALRTYSLASYRIINPFLRNPESVKDAELRHRILGKGAGLQETIKEMDSALARSHLDKPAEALYRGMRTPDPKMADDPESFIGKTFSDPSFASFSESEVVGRKFSTRGEFGEQLSGGGVLFRLKNVPAGTKALRMGSLSSNPIEKEVLFPRNQSFKIVGAEKSENGVIFDAEPA